MVDLCHALDSSVCCNFSLYVTLTNNNNDCVRDTCTSRIEYEH
jgi:hypothetical protein